MNVVLILCDQLAARWLPMYGCRAGRTPNLDALAARGTVFERCISNMPVCMPARSSMMTGRSAQHHGVFYNGWELGLDLPTYPQLLQQAGCRTLAAGKFHLECHGRGAHNDVLKYGFDEAYVTEDIRAGDWLDWVREAHPEHYQQALATVWPVPHTSNYGPDHRDLRSEILAAREQHPAQQVTHLTYPSIVPTESCQTHWVGDHAVRYLAAQPKAQPFFLYASFVDPHDPYDPPAEYLERIDFEEVPAPVEVTDAALDAGLKRFREIPFMQRFRDLKPDDWRLMRQYYLASVAFIDDQVGRIVQAVEDQGLTDDTTFLFAADHGDMLGDHGLAAKGAYHLDACYHVPLLIAQPGGAARREERVVSLLDLFPTICDYAGVETDLPLEGDSLRPLVNGGSLDRPNAVLIETFGTYGVETPAAQATSVITPEANLTLCHDGAGMLFDLAADPDETVNLFDQSRAAALQQRMSLLMRDLEIAKNVPPPRRNRHPWAQH